MGREVKRLPAGGFFMMYYHFTELHRENTVVIHRHGGRNTSWQTLRSPETEVHESVNKIIQRLSLNIYAIRARVGRL